MDEQKQIQTCKLVKNKMSRGSVETMKYVDSKITNVHLRNIRDELASLYKELLENVDLTDYSKDILGKALLSPEFPEEIRETIKSAMF